MELFRVVDISQNPMNEETYLHVVSRLETLKNDLEEFGEKKEFDLESLLIELNSIGVEAKALHTNDTTTLKKLEEIPLPAQQAVNYGRVI